MKKILVVDDHPIVLEGLSGILKREGYAAVSAVSGSEAIGKLTAAQDISIAVIDLNLGDGVSGLDLISAMRNICPGIRILVYTMYDDLWNVSKIMELGVDGIVVKGDSIGELTKAVRSVAEGTPYVSERIRRRVEDMRCLGGKLSVLDLNVLRMISEGHSTAAIASSVFLTEKSVEYHRKNILKKLDARNMTEAIRKAVRLGIISCIAGVMPVMAVARDLTEPVAVDLGLSVKWADRNLGAPSPHEAGGFYALGETEVKERYDWNSYIHCDFGDMFLQHDIGENSICATEYDAAANVLGGGWRMPEAEEVQELMENCSMQIYDSDDSSLAYARFTAESGAYIDIPVAGYMSNSTLIRENIETTLLSGTLEVESGEEDGFSYYFNSAFGLGIALPATAILVQVSAHLGFQIRPVCDIPDKAPTMEESAAVTAVYSIDGVRMPAECNDLPDGVYIFRYSDSSARCRMLRK